MDVEEQTAASSAVVAEEVQSVEADLVLVGQADLLACYSLALWGTYERRIRTSPTQLEPFQTIF